MKNKHLNTNKTSGFKVPKNYFEGLETAILTQTTLKTNSKTSGFNVPDHYFETIETSVISKLNNSEPKLIQLFSKKIILSVSSIAAAIVILFSLNLTQTTPSLDNLELETVESYILDEIEINDLNLLINNTELSQTDFLDYNLLEIEDYIDNIDLNDLYQD